MFWNTFDVIYIESGLHNMPCIVICYRYVCYNAGTDQNTRATSAIMLFIDITYGVSLTFSVRIPKRLTTTSYITEYNFIPWSVYRIFSFNPNINWFRKKLWWYTQIALYCLKIFVVYLNIPFLILIKLNIL